MMTVFVITVGLLLLGISGTYGFLRGYEWGFKSGIVMSVDDGEKADQIYWAIKSKDS